MSSTKTVAVESIWKSAACTSTGRVRARNEDALLEMPELGLWAVADGMGGHADGDIASNLIITRLLELTPEPNMELLADQVQAQVSEANRELYLRSMDGIRHASGATVAILLLSGLDMICLWAGDSRIYRFNGGRLTQLTRDHNLAEELVEQRLISQEAASGHPAANQLTRAVGVQPEVELERVSFVANHGDIFLLCSDGLNKEVSDEEIEAMMAFGGAEDICEALLNLALQRGARDNVTLIAVSLLAV